jgi:hypothetical protein
MSNLYQRYSVSILNVFIIFALSIQILQAQDDASLQEAIEMHYRAINAGETETVTNQHLPDFSIFSRQGYMLVSRNDFETANKVGFSLGGEENDEGSSSNLVPYNFSAQIYDHVGLATFYLWGSYGTGEDNVEGIWRVSAVWIFEDGEWREAHHHESDLKIPGDS